MRIGNTEDTFGAGTKAVASTVEFEIRDATPDDLEAILTWLELEYKRDGHGFWSNQNLITKGQAGA